jgi:hypothetical protein
MQLDDLHGKSVLQFANDVSFDSPDLFEAYDYPRSDLTRDRSHQPDATRADINRMGGKFAAIL